MTRHVRVRIVDSGYARLRDPGVHIVAARSFVPEPPDRDPLGHGTLCLQTFLSVLEAEKVLAHVELVLANFFRSSSRFVAAHCWPPRSTGLVRRA